MGCCSQAHTGCSDPWVVPSQFLPGARADEDAGPVVGGDRIEQALGVGGHACGAGSSSPASIGALGWGVSSSRAPHSSSGRAGPCASTSTTVTPGQVHSGRRSASRHTAGSCAGYLSGDDPSRRLGGYER
jgi:hypothetical protein